MLQNNGKGMRKLVPGLLILWFCVFSAYAAVYKWVDEKGKIHYSDTRPEQAEVIEEEVDIQNEPMPFMDERENRLLDDFEERREQQREKQREEQVLKEKEQTLSKPHKLAVSKVKKGRECFSNSPSKTGIGVSYLEVNPRLLRDSELNTLENIFSRVAGRWKGKVEGYTCLGKEDAPNPRPDDYDIDLRAELDISDNLHMEVEFRSKTKGVSREELYHFYITDDLLRFGTENARGDVELIDLNRRGFSFRHAYWLKRGVVRFERFFTLGLTETGIEVEDLIYSQGVLGHVSVWTLSKTR